MPSHRGELPGHCCLEGAGMHTGAPARPGAGGAGATSQYSEDKTRLAARLKIATKHRKKTFVGPAGAGAGRRAASRSSREARRCPRPRPAVRARA